MKRNHLHSALACMTALVLSACTNFNEDLAPDFNQSLETKEYTSMTLRLGPSSPDTKSHLEGKNSEGNYPVYWDEKGDTIMLIQHAQHYDWDNYVLTAEAIDTTITSDYTVSEDRLTATFEDLKVVKRGEEFDEFGYGVATPQAVILRFDANHGNFIYTIKAKNQQKPLINSYDPSAAPQMGYAYFRDTQPESLDIEMEHMLAYARMTIKNLESEDKVQSVFFSATKPIAAEQATSYWLSRDRFDSFWNKTETISMDMSSLDLENSEFDVYFSLLPTDFEAGDSFSVSVYTDKEIFTRTFEMTAEKLLSFQRGVITEFRINFDGIEGKSMTPPADEIWYMTSTNQALTDQFISSMSTDQNVMSHTYTGGLGVVKYAGDITEINSYFLSGFSTNPVTAVYVPDGIKSIGDYFLSDTEIKTFRLPSSLETVGDNLFTNCKNLESFTGAHVSSDGKSIVIDETLVAVATAGIENYEMADQVKRIGNGVFANNRTLKSIVIAPTVEYIGDVAFANCTALETVTLPSSLESVGSHIFSGCLNLKELKGDTHLRTADGKCLLNPSPGGGYSLNFYAPGGGEEEYAIPSGYDITVINSNAFVSNTLKRITLIEGLETITASAFTYCTALEGIYGPNTSSDHRAIVMGDQLVSLVVYQGITEYRIPDDITSIGYMAFNEVPGIKRITMGDQVTQIGGYAFMKCPDLEHVTLSANLTEIIAGSGFVIYPFHGCQNLTEIYFRSPIPPRYTPFAVNPNENINPALKMYVPEGYVHVYKRDAGWKRYETYFTDHKYNDLPHYDFYITSDFTMDGEVVTLNTATKGNGINVVLLGDAFDDRAFSDNENTYDTNMKIIRDALFSKEPFKSHIDYFNVKYVKAVSAVSGYGKGATAVGGENSSGLAVMGNDEACLEYARKAFPDTPQDNLLIITLLNMDLGPNASAKGTCYMHDPVSQYNQYAPGLGVAYFTLRRDAYDYIVSHEAIGHGFAKLTDEYFVTGTTIPEETLTREKQKQNSYGWYFNVSFNKDKDFDPWIWLYGYDGVGHYAGASNYEYGAWRPTENSIMRGSSDPEFNAPSRYAIYRRIHYLASGENKTVDQFKEWDVININSDEQEE